MADVLVTFKEQTSREQRQSLLAMVGRWQGVRAVGPLQHDAPRGFEHFSFVRVEDNQADFIANELRKFPEVDAAELAPRRSLA